MTPKDAFNDIMHELRQRHMDMYADCDKEIVGLIIDEMNKRENIVDKALTELEELKKRDTPMKISKTDEYIVFAPIKNVTCPRCNQATRFSHRQSTTKKYKPNYCSNCGQRLDWSDGK